MIGFRSKLLAYAIDRENIRIFLKSIGHSVNIFDFIEINKDTKYPYGSYFIKDISSNMGIRNIALPHGTSLYVADHLYPKNINLDFDKIFVSDHRYKEYMKASCVKAGTEVTALGDPRFDTGWKNVLKKVALRNNILSRLRIGHYNKVILYLCPNLEQIKLDKTKYENLKDVARAVMGIEDAVFLVKPHPRYRNERLIRKAMKELGFNHYRILSDDPAICYADIVDYVISSATSAFFDFLPVYRKKVLIYDNFMEEAGVKNLFKEYLDPFGQFFRDCQSLSEYLSRQTDISDNDDQLSEEDLGFESRMIAGGGSPEKIVENYCQYFIKELEKVDG
jgi:hypothetical protein